MIAAGCCIAAPAAAFSPVSNPVSVNPSVLLSFGSGAVDGPPSRAGLACCFAPVLVEGEFWVAAASNLEANEPAWPGAADPNGDVGGPEA